MKAGNFKLNLKIYTYIVVFLMGVLGFRLAIVQLFNNDIYQTQAKENRIRLVAIKAPRGEIYTQNGEVLASNKLVYTLSLTYMEINDYEQVVKQLVDILKDYYPEITVDFINNKIESQKNRLFEPVIIMRDIPWELVVKLEERRRELLGVTVAVEPLRFYPQSSLAGHVLGYIHSINPDELSKTEVPKYSIASLIGKSGVEKYYEQQLRGKDGARRVEVDARGRPVRELVTLEPESGNNLYLTLNLDLQKVMEKSLDTTLKNLQSKSPKAKVGSAVVINVRTGEILAMCSSPDMYPDDWKGNLSSDRLPYYIPQSTYDPLNPGAIVNRAIQSTYPPGSTFKPVTGMAALERGIMDPENDYVNCGGAYWIAPYIKCTGVHGNVNYKSGMAVSCNTYFQEMGRRAGKDEIVRVAGEMGLGSLTGVDLPEEEKGLLPSPAWKKETAAIITDRKYEALQKELEKRYADLLEAANSDEERERLIKKQKNEKVKLEAQYNIDYNFDTSWQAFDTFNMSIGQGYNDYSVLQLANYAATIANNGNLLRPRVVQKIVSHDNKLVKEYKPELIKKADINETTLELTREAMLQVTQPGGTAYFLFSHFPQNVKVAAKTGTAETGRSGDDPKREFHGVFLAFAPFENPEIAFAGVVEYGQHGSESAGWVARAVFEQYFGLVDHLAAEKAEQKVKVTVQNNQIPIE
ncbi:MAG: penicillin-binding protein 2 [Syntrophomonadaceae bacterium]|nr:penicillin-binding protein 2 [Syntrophomonadaceae bacterium]